MFQRNGQTDFLSYREMIPKEIRNKTITDVIITTYSLDGALADDLLFAIYGYEEKMKDVINGKTSCRIFYHSKHSTGHFDSLYQQYSCDGRKLHSKIILIRYKDSNGDPAYFIVVSSMNLAYSNFIDTYFSAYGKKITDGKNDNGAGIGKFLKDYLQYDKLTEELRSVHFETGNKDIQDIQDIEFLTAEGVAEKLKNLKATELIVVSPFININAFDNPDKKNTKIHIYSTQSSIDRLSASEGFTYHVLNKPKNNSQEDTEKNRTENHSEGSELKNKEIHAKILCWKDDDKTHFILGSSNATKNGYHNNIEFNVYFTTPGEYYEEYTGVLNGITGVLIGMFKDTEPATEKTVANDDVSNESDFEDLFEEIFRILKKSRNEIRMHYDHNNENSLYTCEINNLLLIKLPLSKTPGASVKINGKDLIEIFKNGCKLEGEKRFDDLRIEITIGNNSKSRFYYIGDLWQMDNIIKEEEWQYVKKACNELTDKIVFGKRKRKTDRQTENTREANAKKSNPPKLDSYEKLLSFCSKNSIKDEALKKKLQELKDSGINYFKELYNSFYGEMKENDHEQ